MRAGSIGHQSHCNGLLVTGGCSELEQRATLLMQEVRKEAGSLRHLLAVTCLSRMLLHKLVHLVFTVKLTVYALIPFPFYKRQLRFGRLNMSPKTQVTCTRRSLSQGWNLGLSD